MRLRLVVTCISVFAVVMVPAADASAQSFCFDVAMNYTAGSAPQSVSAADLDGDGDFDLVVANAGSDNVSVRRNNGDGSFAAAVNYAIGRQPMSVIAADLEQDGDADLVVANSISNDVAILKNNGYGSFAAPERYAVNSQPWSVFAADLDWDGDLDIAVGTRGLVSILMNNGIGMFSAAVYYAAGLNPACVFPADLDGDGDLDLAAANYSSSNVSILRNDGDGSFGAPVNHYVGSFPYSVVAADLDGDGDFDLAVGNQALPSVGVKVLKNNGDGSFTGPVSYAAGNSPSVVITADLDGDGTLDLAAANLYSNNVSVLKNNGDGSFAAPLNYATGSWPYSVFAAGLDGDTDLDLVAANFNSGNVSVLLNCLDPVTPYAAVDILPQQCPNRLFAGNLQEPRGVVAPLRADAAPLSSIPIAVAGDPSFDIRDINPAAVFLHGVQAQSHKYADVTCPAIRELPCDCYGAAPDGRTDLVLNFDKAAILTALDPVYDRELRTLTLTARLKDGRVIDGSDCLIVFGGESAAPVAASRSESTALSSSYPNPFNTSTAIAYWIEEPGHVSLEIVDVRGRRVAVLVDQNQPAGKHQAGWDAHDYAGRAVASGMYFYRLQIGDQVETGKMVLLK